MIIRFLRMTLLLAIGVTAIFFTYKDIKWNLQSIDIKGTIVAKHSRQAYGGPRWHHHYYTIYSATVHPDSPTFCDFSYESEDDTYRVGDKATFTCLRYSVDKLFEPAPTWRIILLGSVAFVFVCLFFIDFIDYRTDQDVCQEWFHPDVNG